jgi:FtsP/CotA-like multicopper oxidase with cupredoxin domain
VAIAAEPTRADRHGLPDVEVALRATVGAALLDPASGRPTEVWRFEGRLIKGPADALVTSTDGYLGPTFRVRPGQRVRIRFDNALAEDSIVHWHGLDVSVENDGHPRFAVGPGDHYAYDFQVTNRPGTYWYHPHPDRRTGPQIYAGLAGLFIVSDGDDEARGLPGPPFDLPLVLQDRLLGDLGELVYAPDAMVGMLGDRIFVNGRPSPTIDVKAGSYRLRVLNASNARIYKLAWSDGSPMTVVGTDGGLLQAPTSRPYLMLAPGERVELWADFGRAPAGDDLWLESHAFAVGGTQMMGMGGGMMRSGRGGPVNGSPMRLCRFSVHGKGLTRPLPRQLAPVHFRSAEEVINQGAPRSFEVSMMMMRWVLNGRPFGMTEVAPNERIKLGATEEWEFWNLGGMGMAMATAHPIHLHGGQFQIVSRAVAPAWQAAASTMTDGLLDEGWKDTFLLMPGQRVRVRVRFANHAGLYLYHCHNLEHEDMGMMRNFLVEGERK